MGGIRSVTTGLIRHVVNVTTSGRSITMTGFRRLLTGGKNLATGEIIPNGVNNCSCWNNIINGWKRIRT